ncbi:hypothetical protein AGOR_G00098820 [Albula goreensis]|uniref:Uncharacterized protein n=1 Tax=Albula goreensis TaxID=1534307 RepID=A0A8T3DK05_9TELE|nr:hypothetical protein AGOR_G00098820 [Albula goreensis]
MTLPKGVSKPQNAVWVEFERTIESMAGHDAATQHQFTGIRKYFNAYTITGRRNCVLATYAGIAAIFLFFKLKPKKQVTAS